MSPFGVTLPLLALCQLVISAAAPAVHAQESDLTITGVIGDTTGRALTGAQLRIPDLHVLVKPDSAGRFQVRVRAKPGCYELVAVSIGFGPTVQAVRVRPGISVLHVGRLPLQPAFIPERDAFVLDECRPNVRTRYATGGFYVTGKDSVP